ncbi:MAG: adenosylcobinamide-GDP ribazoletransferase, partial [Mesorhizobium sp.]
MAATGNDEPLADLADGQGNPLGASGYRRGGRSLAEAIWAAPFAGLAVAVIGALVYAIVGALGLAAGPAAALALAATMLVTGCLHEDGLSDIADGLGGGRTREKKLE